MEPKKKIKWKDLWIGLLALSSFIIITVGIVMMGEGEIDFFKDVVHYRTFLPEANGLKSGSEVWLAGVEVGEVVSVRFADTVDSLASESIEVTLEVDARVRHRIRNNSVASLLTIGLLGDKYVAIQPGTPDEPVIPTNGIIRGISLSMFDELVGVGRTTARGFNEMLVELRRLAEDVNNEEGSMGKLIHDDELYRNLNKTVQQTTSLIASAEQGPGTLGRFMSDATLYNNLVESSVSTRRTIALMDSTLKSANELLFKFQRSDGTIGKLTNDLAMYEHMETTLSRLDTLIQKIERGEGTLGRLTQSETLSQEMEGVMMDMRTLIHDFKKNPQKYIKVSVF